MVEHGLEVCRHVADIGTGGGLFLSRNAGMHPDTEFIGINDKSSMIAEAEPFNNLEINPQLFSESLYREALLYDYILYGNTGDDELRDLQRFLDNEVTPERHVVLYGMVMLAAKKR